MTAIESEKAPLPGRPIAEIDTIARASHPKHPHTKPTPPQQQAPFDAPLIVQRDYGCWTIGLHDDAACFPTRTEAVAHAGGGR
jgi:hypothetical protein